MTQMLADNGRVFPIPPAQQAEELLPSSALT